jgi:CheY-like chemotaxis protein/DNA-binding XRE family transcriptional regulator
LGITQEELAWRADLHRTYVADIERGARNVTLWTIANLAKALRVTAGNLLSHGAMSSGTAPRTSAGSAPDELREILLVDHNSTVAVTMARAFERAKLANPIKIVRDGETGLDYLFGTGRYAKRTPARPQLILLVLDLPRMSSQEFLLRVRGDERTRDIPVVPLTVSHPSSRR